MSDFINNLILAGVPATVAVVTLTQLLKWYFQLEGRAAVGAAAISALVVTTVLAAVRLWPGAITDNIVYIFLTAIGLLTVSMGAYSGGKTLRGK